jgi:hypothetical protein
MDAQASARAALEILEAPERGRRAAEQAPASAGVQDAQRTLRRAVAKRPAELSAIEAELAGWFQVRPMAHLAQLKEGLGEHRRAAIDR